MGRGSTWPIVGTRFQREHRQHASGVSGQLPGLFRQSHRRGQRGLHLPVKMAVGAQPRGPLAPGRGGCSPRGCRRRARCPPGGKPHLLGQERPRGSVHFFRQPLCVTSHQTTFSHPHYARGLLLLGGRAWTPGTRSVGLASRFCTVAEEQQGLLGAGLTPQTFPPTLAHNSTIFVATKENSFIRHRAHSR